MNYLIINGSPRKKNTWKMVNQAKSNLKGDFEVKVGTVTLANIMVEDYDTKKIQDGYLNGKFTVTPSEGIKTILRNSYDISLNAITDYSLVADINSSDGKIATGIAVKDGSKELISLEITGAYGAGKKVDIPKKATNDEDEWVESISTDKVLKNLEDKVNVPTKYINMLENALDYYY